MQSQTKKLNDIMKTELVSNLSAEEIGNVRIIKSLIES